METINIVNNNDHKIIIQNILITNQYELMIRCNKFFESGYLAKNNLSIEETKDFFNKQKFINWDMFIELINLDFEMYDTYTKNNLNTSEDLDDVPKSPELIEFLLNMDLNLEQNLINWDCCNEIIFLLIFKNLCSNDTICDKTIDLMIKNNWIHLFTECTNIYDETILFYIISKCSESIIIKMLKQNLIDIGWKDKDSNNLIHWTCKRNFVNMFDWVFANYPDNKLFEEKNNDKRTPIHIACIENNLNLTKLLEEKNQEQIVNLDSYLKTHIHYAIINGNKDLVLYLLKKYAESDFNFTPDLFYYTIVYQDEETIEYFIDNTNLNINDTNLFRTLELCIIKKHYSIMYNYSHKKSTIMTHNFLHNFFNSYDGHCMDDFFNDDIFIY